MAPLLPADEDYSYILKLAICLSYLSRNFDQTQPPKAISEYILSSEIPFQHKDRVMLALILFYSTNFKPDANITKISRKLLSKKDHSICQIIGNYIRIAKEIDGPLFISPTFDIVLQNYFLEIDSKEILPRPIFEKVCDRLKSIAFARRMILNNRYSFSS
jgi:exopolyphosphatase/guanosine-5'-triphosphate,3'-diphosphate pyrophosphatase